MDAVLRDLDEALAIIPDGAMVVVPPEYGGVAMAATRALIRRGIKGLHLVTLPASSLQADMLIGAGAVATIETSAVSLGEFGPAPRFGAAVTAGTVRVMDATCPAIHAALQAAEKGVPFMPLRGLIGSDLIAHRPDWRVIDNPFAAAGDPIVLLPAIRPDVALFHAPMADRAGNVWIGRRRELATMAHAAAKTIVTVERIHDGDLLANEASTAGVLPALYVEAIAVAPQGAWPLPLAGEYKRDEAHLAEYAALAATADGFQRYLERYVFTRKAA
jgi:glutaconate CoA-transferase, subunit A